MKGALFDTHCHLGGVELQGQAEDLVQRAIQNSVLGFGLISADLASLHEVFRKRTFLRSKFTESGALFAASAGIHPHEANSITDEDWNAVKSYSKQAEAIGETGLDFYYNHSEKDLQIDYFRKHIELSLDLKKPLVIHCRNAAVEVLSILTDYKKDFLSLQGKSSPGILHCFTEDQKMAEALLDMGFYISFSGILTFRNAENLRQVFKSVPLDRVLIETDSPWLAPIPHRGKTNEPAFVSDVFRFARDLLEVEESELMKVLWQNSTRVFFQNSV